MLRFIAAAFLILCFAACNVSAASVDHELAKLDKGTATNLKRVDIFTILAKNSMISLNVSRRPDYKGRWNTFDNIEQVKSFAMMFLSQIEDPGIIEKDRWYDLISTISKAVKDPERGLFLRGFSRTYPNKPSKVLAILALLDPPSFFDRKTTPFILKNSAEILSTGGSLGFNYKKNTSKKELLALYQTAWNTGVRQSYGISNRLQELAEKLIKKADTSRPGYDEQRLINHQAMAFTIAAKAAVDETKIANDQIMDALNGQLRAIWGRTITKKFLADKLDALNRRMQ